MKRRGVFIVCLGFSALLLKACLSAPPPREEPAVRLVPQRVTRRLGDVTVHLVNTGWVRVKQVHRTLDGPLATRMLRIATARDWTEFMPVYVAVVVHPEGVFLFDTGLSEDTLRDDHAACDPGTHFVYRHLLDFRFAPEQRIDRQLQALGIEPSSIAGVVFSHRHADHTDGFGALPDTTPAWVGAGDWPTHAGALSCRWPQGRVPRLVSEEGPSMAAFPHAIPLTRDGRLAIVPTTGHSPGSLSLLLHTAGADVVFAGDAAFDVEQIATRTLAGIVEDPVKARRALDVLAAQVDRFPTMLVLAHDPVSAARFEAGRLTTLR